MTKPNIKTKSKCFGGWVQYYNHTSTSCQSEMRFSVFVPPQAESRRVPILYWLSGLTCTEENFMIKAGAQKYAAKHGILLVAPTTSPGPQGIEGESASYDLGVGAGFYVNATEKKWAKHYRMYDYITKELPEIITANFNVDATKQSIFGHSMGGHGALVAALKNPGRYQSVSAFAPICAPSKCPWGQKAFREYLGSAVESWHAYDASELMSQAKHKMPIFIDQGAEDPYLAEQLLIDSLRCASKKNDYPVEIRMQQGYDHSYYFISSFIEDHMDYHAKYLLQGRML